MRQGTSLTEHQIARVRYMLQDTEMTIGEIAERMNVSRSCINRVNQALGVRNYNGQRNTWTINSSSDRGIAA